ncbi:MAG TPA: DUF1178 family protein [Burkholderiales bacterium]|nr:DUF1178 family protein [Burkholderiales bacterium]
MKIFDLQCGSGHRFEGWFASADEFTVQRARGQVSCPSCGAQEVDRVPSATRFNTGAPPPMAREEAGKDPLALAQKLYSRMLDELLKHSEDVGAEFPAEARRIHHREAPERMIRGQATQEEHAELIEEGIPVLRMPIPPAKDWN